MIEIRTNMVPNQNKGKVKYACLDFSDVPSTTSKEQMRDKDKIECV